MKMLVFTVYDSKVERYLQPFFQQTKGQAARTWRDTVNQKDHQFSRHPADYTLFEIGSYDDEHGTFENHRAPIPVGTALEFQDSMATEITNDVTSITRK